MNIRNESLGMNRYTILGSKTHGSPSTGEHEITAPGVKMNTSTQHCLKKNKIKQRITPHHIEFTHSFRKHLLRTCSVVGTMTGDELPLEGSESDILGIVGQTVSVTAGQSC